MNTKHSILRMPNVSKSILNISLTPRISLWLLEKMVVDAQFTKKARGENWHENSVRHKARKYLPTDHFNLILRQLLCSRCSTWHRHLSHLWLQVAQSNREKGLWANKCNAKLGWSQSQRAEWWLLWPLLWEPLGLAKQGASGSDSPCPQAHFWLMLSGLYLNTSGPVLSLQRQPAHSTSGVSGCQWDLYVPHIEQLGEQFLSSFMHWLLPWENIIALLHDSKN